MTEGTDAADSDPRKAGFQVATRPRLRGIGSPPPRPPARRTEPPAADAVTDLDASPEVTPVDEEAADQVEDPPAPAPAPAPKRAPSSGRAPSRKVRSADPAEAFGTQRGRLRYVSTSVSVEVANRWEHAAETEDLALGEILMRAVRNHHKAIRTGTQGAAPRRRRRGVAPVRREVSLRPEEAVSVFNHAQDAGLNPSAFMRAVLERELLGPKGK